MSQNERLHPGNAPCSTDGSDRGSSLKQRGGGGGGSSTHNKSVSSNASPAPHRSR